MASEDGGYRSQPEGDEDQQDQQSASPSEPSVFLYQKHNVDVKLSISPENLNAVIYKNLQTSHEYQRVTGFMISEVPTNPYCVTQAPSHKFSIVCKESVHSGLSVTCELWRLTVSRDEAFECKQKLQKWAMRQNLEFIDAR